MANNEPNRSSVELNGSGRRSRTPGEQPQPSPKRLQRSKDDRWILGVCGGLGEYFDIDPTFFRIGFAAALFPGGIGGPMYLLLYFLMPSAEHLDDHPRDAARASVDEAMADLQSAAVSIGDWVVARNPFGQKQPQERVGADE